MSKTFEIDLSKEINDTFYPLILNQSRYLVCYGGAGSGKSHFVAQKLLLRIMFAMAGGYRERFLCLRKTGPAAKLSIFALFNDYIDKWNLRQYVSINKTDMTFTFEGGSNIYCGGLDKEEKIKSIEGLTGAWLEEPTEFNPMDFEQIDLRLRGDVPTYLQIILSFNPISRMSWVFKRFFETVDPDAFVHHSTYPDNKFIDEDYKKKLENLKKKTLISTWFTPRGFGAFLQTLFIPTGALLIRSRISPTIYFMALILGLMIRTLYLKLGYMIKTFMSRNYFTRGGLQTHSLSASSIG